MKKSLIDLSYSISESGSRYPSDPAPRITVFPARIEAGKLKSGYTEFAIRSHHGTHIDAPAHKIPGGKTIDQYELSKFINRAILIDLTRHLEPGEDYLRKIDQKLLGQVLTPERLHRMQHEGISALLFRTAYERVIERGVTDDFNFPYFDVEAAAFLVEACDQHSIPLNLVGLDSFSVDPKSTPDSPAHYAFLSKDTLILETLVHLDRAAQAFGAEPFELICPPILYRGADAAQGQAFARPIERGGRP